MKNWTGQYYYKYSDNDNVYLRTKNKHQTLANSHESKGSCVPLVVGAETLP